ncbi:MAG TPA: hypothetical protein VHC19_08335 [Pirellulales bacterium]|nr:hypothetical protein [Pirellulales bacterium]
MAAAMPDESATREDAVSKSASCFIWLLMFAPIGILAVYCVADACANWGERESMRLRHVAMTEQLRRIRQGEIHCLVKPELDCVEELLADAKCAENIEEVYLSGDVSDARLGRLRELPHLKSVILLFNDNPDVFLERLQGMDTLEVLNLEHSSPSRRGVEFIGSLPKIQSLSLDLGRKQAGVLDGIRNLAALEHLTLSWRRCDADILPLLQGLPNLRTVTIENVDDGAKAFEELLQRALPDCDSSVELGP